MLTRIENFEMYFMTNPSLMIPVNEEMIIRLSLRINLTQVKFKNSIDENDFCHRLNKISTFHYDPPLRGLRKIIPDNFSKLQLS